MTRANLVLVMLLAASSSARAEDAGAVLVGPSIGKASSKMSDGEADGTVLSIRLDLGRQVNRTTMAGVHVGAATSSPQDNVQGFSADADGNTYRYHPVDVGAMVAVGGPAVFGAWLGGELGWQSLRCHYALGEPTTCGDNRADLVFGPAFGIFVAVDVFHTGQHHVAITGAFEIAKSSGFTYSSIGAGVAYRFSGL